MQWYIFTKAIYFLSIQRFFLSFLFNYKKHVRKHVLLGIVSVIFSFHSQEKDLHNGWNSGMLSNFLHAKNMNGWLMIFYWYWKRLALWSKQCHVIKLYVMGKIMNEQMICVFFCSSNLAVKIVSHDQNLYMTKWGMNASLYFFLLGTIVMVKF